MNLKKMNPIKAISNKTGFMALTCLVVFSSSASAFAASDQWSLHSLWSKPIVRDAAVGTAIGAGAGLFTHRTSVGRGALTGAVTGAGTGAVRQSKYFQGKPLLRNVTEGAIIGTGTSYATDSSRLKGAAVGAGVGAGYHYLRKYMDGNR